MRQVTTYSAAVFGVSTLSVVSNAFLIYLYYRCPFKKIKNYKYFFLLTAIQDLFASVCINLTAPRTAAQDSYAVFIATGLIHTTPYAECITLVFFLLLTTSILLLTNSFAYRYVHLCQSRYSYIYESWKWITVIVVINCSIFLMCSTMTMASTMPNTTFKEEIYNEDLARLGSSTAKSFVGFSMKHSLNSITVPFLAACLATLFSLSSAGVFFAASIQRKLRETSLSSRTRRLQRQLFQMLLLQTICPTVLLYLPSSFIFFVLFTSTRFNFAIVDWVGISYSLYPFFNPLMMMFFINDYRNYITSLFKKKTTALFYPSTIASTRTFNTVSTKSSRLSVSFHL